MPRPSIRTIHPYDVEKPESGVQHTTLEIAGAPTPIRVLDALGPPEIHCNCTKSIDLPSLSARHDPDARSSFSISGFPSRYTYADEQVRYIGAQGQ